MRMLWRFLLPRAFAAAERPRVHVNGRRWADKTRRVLAVEGLEERCNPSAPGSTPVATLVANVQADITQIQTAVQHFQADLTRHQTDEMAEEQAEMSGGATKILESTIGADFAVLRIDNQLIHSDLMTLQHDVHLLGPATASTTGATTTGGSATGGAAPGKFNATLFADLRMLRMDWQTLHADLRSLHLDNVREETGERAHHHAGANVSRSANGQQSFVTDLAHAQADLTTLVTDLNKLGTT